MRRGTYPPWENSLPYAQRPLSHHGRIALPMRLILSLSMGPGGLYAPHTFLICLPG